MRREPKVGKAHRITKAAKETGVARSTIIDAIERGEIPVYHSGCGMRMVKLADVTLWDYKHAERTAGRRKT